jgi:hypothetical protein
MAPPPARTRTRLTWADFAGHWIGGPRRKKPRERSGASAAAESGQTIRASSRSGMTLSM